MKQAMVEHSSSASHSFLLDDDSTLPFVASDILAQMDDKVSAQSGRAPTVVNLWLPRSSKLWDLAATLTACSMQVTQHLIVVVDCTVDSK